jgi:Secretion system C-terminal sorting domain
VEIIVIGSGKMKKIIFLILFALFIPLLSSYSQEIQSNKLAVSENKITRYYTGDFEYKIPAKVNNEKNKVLLVNENINNSINIFPNPATDELNITFSENSTCTLRLLDGLGNSVLETDINNQNTARLDISKLAKGFYILEIRNQNGTKSNKKVIIK